MAKFLSFLKLCEYNRQNPDSSEHSKAHEEKTFSAKSFFHNHNTYIYIYAHTHTYIHTLTHTYTHGIYIYIYIESTALNDLELFNRSI